MLSEDKIGWELTGSFWINKNLKRKDLITNWSGIDNFPRNERRFYYNVMLLWVQHMFSF